MWPKPPRTLDVHGNMDTPSQFPNMEMMYYRKTMELMDEGKESEEEVTRREDLRKVRGGGVRREGEGGVRGGGVRRGVRWWDEKRSGGRASGK